MKPSALYAAIATLVLAFASNVLASPEEGDPPRKPKPAPTAKKDDKLAEQRAAAAKIKKLDINSASKQELMKLPGIAAADADKIIAGRPYGSKVWLMTHKVLSQAAYGSVAELVEARQPFKDAAKNAALYEPKKR